MNVGTKAVSVKNEQLGDFSKIDIQFNQYESSEESVKHVGGSEGLLPVMQWAQATQSIAEAKKKLTTFKVELKEGETLSEQQIEQYREQCIRDAIAASLNTVPKGFIRGLGAKSKADDLTSLMALVASGEMSNEELAKRVGQMATKYGVSATPKVEEAVAA